MIPSDVKELLKEAIKEWMLSRAPQAMGCIPQSILQEYKNAHKSYSEALAWLEQQEVEP